MHTIRKILIFVILAIGSVSGQMLTRILRDEINGNNMRRNNLISSSEATENADADSVPYVGGPNQWRVPLSNGTGFITPTFLLDTNTPATPTFAIFAIEIQNNLTDGACGTPSTQLARIRLSEVSIGIVGAENLITVPSYQDGGDSELRLQRMGLTDENNLIRFNIPRMDGDIVQFQIAATNPDFEDPDPLDVCLQVEFLGARITMGSPDPPSINESPLLQYNMNRPDFSYLGNSYDDLAYSGVRGSLYTGGVGVLTDGIIGTNPVTSTAEWVGFSSQGRVRLFLNARYPIKDIAVFFWMDTSNGAVPPTGGARGRNGQLNQFTFEVIPDDDVPGLYLYTAEAVGDAVMLDYLEIPLGTPQGLLITEISLLDDFFDELINSSAVTLSPFPTDTTDTTDTPDNTETPDNTDNTDSIDIPTTIARPQSSQRPSPSRRPPPPRSQSLPVETIVFSVVGVVVCCCVSIIIMVVSIIVVVAFVYLRKSSKRNRHSVVESISNRTSQDRNGSLGRRLSDRFLGPPSYSQIETKDTGDYANQEVDNLYQDVERPLPLVPGEEPIKEDSYIEMSQLKNPGLTIDTGEKVLKPMRTISEDDYMAVTPPSVAANAKQPPARFTSTPYVSVTPPHSPVKPSAEKSEANSDTPHLEFKKVDTIDNEYV